MREHVDVLIVGAGLSGIGSACHLKTNCPDKTFAILEARDAIGGTWDLFRYPGIRSDSDMFTLGYSFKPWESGKAIADGPDILGYVRETAREHDVERHIRFQHRVVRADWSSADQHWTVEVERTDSGETFTLTCGFVFGCTGYYRYDEGYTPELKGVETFQGPVIHPQHWPEDLDYAGKRVVVIGSGATAMTLVPAMAESAAHVTMLQRSPGYVLSLPAKDPIANLLRKVLPANAAYQLVRLKNVGLTTGFFNLSRKFPKFVRGAIRAGVKRRLPKDYEVDTHFKPKYNPWDQRVCLVPDGDLFRAIKKGKASMATGRIDTITATGVRLESGEELEADILITATGLNLLMMGGITASVDGEEVVPSERVAYKGMMLSGVPNFAMALGYTNASWTLKCDLVGEYVCRLLNHMDEHGYTQATPRAPDPALPREPFIDLMSGYVLRSIDELPKQGDRRPWRLHQNWLKDILLLRRGEIEDEGIEFSRAGERVDAPEPLAA